MVRSLLQALVERMAKVTVVDAKGHIEHELRYERSNGFDSLTGAFKAR